MFSCLYCRPLTKYTQEFLYISIQMYKNEEVVVDDDEFYRLFQTYTRCEKDFGGIFIFVLWYLEQKIQEDFFNAWDSPRKFKEIFEEKYKIITALLWNNKEIIESEINDNIQNRVKHINDLFIQGGFITGKTQADMEGEKYRHKNDFTLKVEYFETFSLCQKVFNNSNPNLPRIKTEEKYICKSCENHYTYHDSDGHYNDKQYHWESSICLKCGRRYKTSFVHKYQYDTIYEDGGLQFIN